MKTYAGIGSREAPDDLMRLAEMLADCLRRDGWTLRSGHAQGMDTAFEQGAGQMAEIFLPWPSFGDHTQPYGHVYDRPRREAFTIAKRAHPRWDRLNRQVRTLHARNSHIVLGWSLANPAAFVVCWTPGGETVGGTGQALRLARLCDIPVCNLGTRDGRRQAMGFLESPSNDERGLPLVNHQPSRS